jgi:hypothetical protein
MPQDDRTVRRRLWTTGILPSFLGGGIVQPQSGGGTTAIQEPPAVKVGVASPIG